MGKVAVNCTCVYPKEDSSYVLLPSSTTASHDLLSYIYPMPDEEMRGRSKSPGRERSRSRHRRGASRDRDRKSAHTSSRPDTGWCLDPFSHLSLHVGKDCKICDDYYNHFRQATITKDPSMLASLEERAQYLVPIDRVNDVFRDRRELNRLVDKMTNEEDRTRREITEIQADFDAARQQIEDKDRELDIIKRTLEETKVALSRATTMQADDDASDAPSSKKRKNFGFDSSVSTSTSGSSWADVARPGYNQMLARMPGPVHPTPPSVGPPIDMSNPYEVDDERDYDLEDPDYFLHAKTFGTTATGLLLARLRKDDAAIAALPPNHPVRGRARQAVSINPKSAYEFDQISKYLHDEPYRNAELFAAVGRYMAGIKESGKTNRTPVQLHAQKTWRRPNWAPAKSYDPMAGRVREIEGTTVSDQKKNKHRSKAAAMVLDISNKLGLSINGHANPMLGNVGSPLHGDHPAIWANHWKFFANSLPRGLFASEGSGYVPQRLIRAFRNLAPLLAFTCDDAFDFKVKYMALLVVPGRYQAALEATGRDISTTRSWDPVVVPSNVDEHTLAISLAERGLSVIDADDALPYARHWLKQVEGDLEASEHNRALARDASNTASRLRRIDPYEDVMIFEYSSAHRRWMAAPRRVTQPGPRLVPSATAPLQPVAASSSLVPAGEPGLKPLNPVSQDEEMSSTSEPDVVDVEATSSSQAQAVPATSGSDASGITASAEMEVDGGKPGITGGLDQVGSEDSDPPAS